MLAMSLLLEDDVVRATGLSEDELRREIAVLLFEKDKLTLGQASKLAAMSQLEFQRLIGGRGICVHYDVEEFREDLATLEDLRKS
jgi:predicted HTH domain antitoxin